MSAQQSPLAVAQRAILDLADKTTAPATIPVTAPAIANAVCKEIAKNPKLAACTVDSIKQAFVEAVTYGLVPGLNGQCYLVPFNNKVGKNQWVAEATLMIGYRGMLDMMRRDGAVQDCYAEIVYSKDHFRLRKGDNPGVDHEPFVGDERGEFVGAYAVAHLTEFSRPRVEWMPKSEIEKVREASKQKNGGKDSPAWLNWPGEMAKKTVLRRAAKTLPCSVDLMKVFEGQVTAEFGESSFSVEQRPAIEMPRRKSEALPPPVAQSSSPSHSTGGAEAPSEPQSGATSEGASGSSSDSGTGDVSPDAKRQPAEGVAATPSAQPQSDGPRRLQLADLDPDETAAVSPYLTSQAGPAKADQNVWLSKFDGDKATLLEAAGDYNERNGLMPDGTRREPGTASGKKSQQALKM